MSAARRERQAERASAPAGRRPAWRAVEALLWAAVALLFVVRVVPQVRAAVGWGAEGAAAPPVTFDLLDGRTATLAGLKGRVVLVNFWATWCPPCRAEMPGIESAYEARRGAGFTVVGVSMDDKAPPQVAAWLREHGIAYPVALGTPAVAAAFGGVNDLPTSFLIDRRGRVRYTIQGMFAGVALRAAVDRLLAERG
jgi:cytochrome c biogenesis protein CcmG, thiol:disulfide interchange protein DsbE